jgi:predicted nucleic acid-binding protein
MLLISDANIFIDLHKIGLLGVCSKLNHQIVTTDFVYNELYPEQQKVLDDLNIKQLTFEVEEIIDFFKIYSTLGNVGISPQDYSLIYKAKKIKGSIVTGDKALRNYIKKENLDVFGIFFIFDEILDEKLLALDEWKIKLEELRNLNDRLPKKEFEKRLLT